MTVWLVKAGEPTPVDAGAPRIMRTGTLARSLTERGHDVVWWAAAFDHQRKAFRRLSQPAVAAGPRLTVRFVGSLGYTRNESLRRWADDLTLAAGTYRAMTRATPRPDVIVCSYPLIFTPTAVLAFARRHRIPVLVDVRDQWPDTFADLAGGARQQAYRVFAAANRPVARWLFRQADGLVGVTEPFLDWALTLAGRPRRALDGVFPLTSFPVELSADALTRARDGLRRLGVTAATRNFCYFGNFSKMVNTFSVVRAAHALRERRDIKLVLCGGGDDLERARALGAGLDTLVLPGFVDAATIRALIDVSVAGLAPYRNRRDARGLVSNKVIEYFSHGLPIVSGLGGLLGELIDRESCGLRYDEDDTDGLVRAIVQLADDQPRREQLGRNARALFERRFRPEMVYEQFARHVEGAGRAPIEKRTHT